MSAGHIVIAGGTGLLGQKCQLRLADLGYATYILTRGPSNADKRHIHWNPATRQIDTNIVDGARAVINLTGMPLDAKRWSPSVKKQLIQSRVEPAQFLGEIIRDADIPPECYIGAGGIGIYGDSGSAPVTESSTLRPPSDHFITRLSEEWEKSHPFQDDMRTIVLRIAVVLSRDGGFLKRVLEPARLGMYGYFGSGKQYLSWIHIDDLVECVVWAVKNEEAQGTYNASAGAISAKGMMQEILRGKGGIGLTAGMPDFLGSVAFGEMAHFLTWGCNASGEKLRKSNFQFSYENLSEALENLLV